MSDSPTGRPSKFTETLADEICDQGRDVGCPTPPSQIPACGITAPGSSGMRAGGTSIMIGELWVDGLCYDVRVWACPAWGQGFSKTWGDGIFHRCQASSNVVQM